MSGSDESGDGKTPGGADPRGRGRRPKSPIDQWFEVFVYAPLGFALDARQLFPKLVDRGRSQVVLARVVGKYAVQHGQTRAERYLGDSQTQLAAVLQALGVLPEEQELDDDGDVAAFEAGTVTFAQPPAAVAEAPEPVDEVPPPDPGELAIPDYDNLSASQVVPRLGGLTPDELEAVRRYELAARGRKTILGKITQLQSA
jgi:hypothetical protein